MLATTAGSGKASVKTAGTVTNTAGTGISAGSTLGAAQVTYSGDVSGAPTGISAVAGTTATIDGAATVQGKGGDAVQATAKSGIAIGQTIALGAVTGGINGIVATNNGTGDVRIKTAGLVTAQNGEGVNASQTTKTGGDIVIAANGGVSAANGNGLDASSASTSGNILVGGGAVTATTMGSGVNAQLLDATSTGNIDIGKTNAIGKITAAGAGIVAGTKGKGNIDVALSANVQAGTAAAGNNGVDTSATSGATNVNVGAFEITAPGGTGVKGTSTSGAITVTVAAGGKIDPLIGVDLSTVNGALSVPNAGLIQGDNIGVRLVSTGAAPAGDLTIAQTGAGTIQITNAGGGAQGVLMNSVDANQVITGAGNATIIDAANGTNGVEANVTGAGNITITDNKITGGTNGIVATQSATGTGSITINGTGDVTAKNGTAISATISNPADAQNITISRTGVIAATKGDGINASSATAGAGNILIDAPTSITTTTTGSGVVATLSAAGATGKIDIGQNAGLGPIVAAGVGIKADNAGTAASAVVNVKTTQAITANGGDGVNAKAAGGKVTILSAGPTIAASSSGIVALGTPTNTGGVSVTNSAAISGVAANTAQFGIFADSAGAASDVTVTNTGNIGTVADRMQQKGIAASISNPVNAGNVSVALDAGSIFSKNAAVDASTTGTGAVTVSGAGTGTLDSSTAMGVSAIINNAANARDVTVTARPAIINAVTAGINAATNGTGNVVVTPGAAQAITVTNGPGIDAQQTGATTGAVTVTTLGGTITTTNGSGINAVKSGTGAGDVKVVNAAVVDTTSAIGVNATSQSTTGAVSVDGPAAVTTHTTGNGVTASLGNAGATGVVNVGQTTPLGIINAADSGIFASNNGTAGTAAINVTTTKAITANNGTGIAASANGGKITILSNGPTIAATGGDGINAAETASNTGGISVVNSAAISGVTPNTAVSGIRAFSAGGAGDVTVKNTGAIGSAGDRMQQSGIIASITGATNAGAAKIDQAAGDVFAVGDALTASNAGLGAATVTGAGTGEVNSSTAKGVVATIANAANGAAVLVDLNAAKINAATGGISATTTGTGSVTVTPSNAALAINVTGAGIGIEAAQNGSGAGNVTVTTLAGQTVKTANGAGVVAKNTGPGAGNVAVTIGASAPFAIDATGGDGVIATSASTSGNVSVDGAGAIKTTTSGNGVTAQLSAAGATGQVNIGQAIPLGIINAANSGIVTTNAGSGATNIRQTNAMTVGSAAPANGIDATATGAGDINVVSNATINGAFGGALKTGIRTSANTGKTIITATAQIGSLANPATASAIDAKATGGAGATSGTLKIAAKANLFGATNGILATGAGGETGITIDPGVTVSATATNGVNLQGSGGGLAADGFGVTNNGTITGLTNGVLMNNSGTVDFANNAAGIVNGGTNGVSVTAGTLNVANAGTVYGVGSSAAANAFNNSATLNIANTGNIGGALGTATSGVIAGAGTTNLTNTGTWNNVGLSSMTTLTNAAGGVIDMRNTVTPLANTITLTGAYTGVGANSVIVNAALVDTGARRTDQIVANGGSGVTAFTVNPTQNAGYFSTPIVLVKNAGTATGTLANASQLAGGVVSYAIQKCGADICLVANVNSGSLASIGGAIGASVAAATAGFFQNTSAFISAPPDAKPNQIGGGLWVRTAAGESTIGSTSVAYSQQSAAYAQASTRTSYTGVQAGYDLGLFNIENTGVNVHVGLTGGQYEASSWDALKSGTSLKVNVPFLGAYLAATGHGFFGDIQVRHDFWGSNVSNTTAMLNQAQQKGRGTAASASLGYHWNATDAFYIEPSAAISYNRLGLDSLSIGSSGGTSATLSFAPVKSLMARAGARIGLVMVVEDKVALSPFLAGSWWRELAGPIRETFTQNNSQIPILVGRVGSFGQFSGGMSMQILGTGITGFVRGDYRTGSFMSGTAINGGLRYQF